VVGSVYRRNVAHHHKLDARMSPTLILASLCRDKDLNHQSYEPRHCERDRGHSSPNLYEDSSYPLPHPQAPSRLPPVSRLNNIQRAGRPCTASRLPGRRSSVRGVFILQGFNRRLFSSTSVAVLFTDCQTDANQRNPPYHTILYTIPSQPG
jgi:hypothetical protein